MSEIKWSGVVENDFTDYDDEPLVKKGDRVYGFLNYFDDVPYILGKIIETDDEYVVVEHWYPVALDSIEVEICGAKISYDRLRELVKADAEGRVVVLPVAIGTPVYMVHYFPAIKFGDCVMEFIGEPIEEYPFVIDMLPLWGEEIFATKTESESALAAADAGKGLSDG